VARTLADEKRQEEFKGEIISEAVESKRDLLKILHHIKAAGRRITEFHFVGHSGMYGPMFGTVAFPEQFSPYEWETMEIPFSASGASAYFHCCRSARWFAPFFSRTFKVPAYGFFWYTTFSQSKTRYRYAGSRTSGKLYTIGCKGRKSHGVAASLIKLAGLMPAETMKLFHPAPPTGDTTYNHVAELYDQAFADIRVRNDEWRWINYHLPDTPGLSLLDIGCGNGALIDALSSRIGYGAGIDESEAMLSFARAKASGSRNIDFYRVESPFLPFEDHKFDIAVSLMSFRYLDWDPLLKEIRRVLKPGGKLLIVDMVTVPVKPAEYARLVKDKLRTTSRLRRSHPSFRTSLHRLVTNLDWKRMLEYNPIRSEHEMKWYLESRFPGHKLEVLNIGWNSRIVAFDSGPVESGVEAVLSYP